MNSDTAHPEGGGGGGGGLPVLDPEEVAAVIASLEAGESDGDDRLLPWCDFLPSSSPSIGFDLDCEEDIECYKRHRVVFSISVSESVYIEEHFVAVLGIHSIKIHFGPFCSFQLCYKDRELPPFQMIVGDGEETSWLVSHEEWTAIYTRRKAIMGLILRDPLEFFAEQDKKKKKKIAKPVQVLPVGSSTCTRIFDKENLGSPHADYEVVWSDRQTKQIRFQLIDREIALGFSEFLPVLDLFRAEYPVDLGFFSYCGIEIYRHQ